MTELRNLKGSEVSFVLPASPRVLLVVPMPLSLPHLSSSLLVPPRPRLSQATVRSVTVSVPSRLTLAYHPDRASSRPPSEP